MKAKMLGVGKGKVPGDRLSILHIANHYAAYEDAGAVANLDAIRNDGSRSDPDLIANAAIAGDDRACADDRFTTHSTAMPHDRARSDLCVVPDNGFFTEVSALDQRAGKNLTAFADADPPCVFHKDVLAVDHRLLEPAATDDNMRADPGFISDLGEIFNDGLRADLDSFPDM